MKDLSTLAAAIQEALAHKLGPKNLDVIDVLAVPPAGDRIVRLRTLEEALEDFDTASGESSATYIVQIRSLGTDTSPAEGASTAAFEGEPQISFAPAPAQTAPAPAPARKREARDAIEKKATPPVTAAGSATASDQVYLGEGKLNVPYLAQNADLLLASGDYTLARNIYKAILQSGERSAMALFGIARCFEGEGKLEPACRHYEESIAYQPSLEAYESLSTLLQKLSKFQAAAEVLERALNLKDQAEQIRFELHQAAGNLWSQADEAQKSEFHYTKALNLRPHAEEIRANLGALCLKSGKTDQALRHFQDALASNPQSAKALIGLGTCHLAVGDKRAAHDRFAQALSIDIHHPTAIFHLVKCAYEIKSYATAARIVEDYVERAPVSAGLLYSLAGLQYHLGRKDDAQATANRILGLAPQHSGAIELLKLISQGQGTATGQAARGLA